ncbi:DUF1080 domain-containing protein [Reichenbachiella carrageenanivorans]|uniref:DUF1080 domain-containing protein n=1 Tax=Reichenbachiella carrageenanivorans TaxID=2979869 RepID=A0ABY6CX17_9BACT|nr:DUF1080 domain-containing protein [Reichenbachiella carrageenanivorans]UXX78457.1 DUF1080 domain-containing protein [Reichenbachiella carrageenanivorans]
MKKLISLFAFILLVVVTANSQNVSYKATEKVVSDDWENLLDKKLSKWEVWTGVPDPSVMGLPDGYEVPEDGKPVEPIGLGDPMGIYKVTKENGELVLNISGQVYAGLTSKKEYKNYHMTLLFKWGEQKYAPRLEQKRDNGLLYHCYGEHGAFWNVWMRSLETQIQEGDFGDLFILAGTQAKVKTDATEHWDPSSSNISKRGKRSVDAESPNGAWTRVDLYVIGDRAVHVTNGVVVLALTDAKKHDGQPLKKGRLQIQSEGAEAYAKDIQIRPIADFPEDIAQAAGF